LPRDARDVPFVTIDPPGSRDLDQAFFAERTALGIRVLYAIADVAAFVVPGSLMDEDAHQRGVTVYLPDERARLYPATIGEGAASLLPDEERPALLWTIDLDHDGAPHEWRIEPALVRSREAITYSDAQSAIDGGSGPESLVLLREIGRLREAQEAARGGVNIAAPVQELRRSDERYELGFEVPLPVEGWNAQVSLLTGMCAAQTMIDHGLGILRTLPSADEATVDRLHRIAAALGIEWPRGASYGDVVRTLDPGSRTHAAFLTEALEMFRGAGYTIIDAEGAASPPEHAGVHAPYAHVTAPLRRLADRYALEIVLAHSTGDVVPEWVTKRLPELPEIMAVTSRRAATAERAVIDLVECIVLQPRVGDVFPATVIDLDGDRATVQLVDPPVLTTLPSEGLTLGAEVQVRLESVHLGERRIALSVA
jgi:exoribonuclease R